jgi:hypothetical protein
VKEEKEKTPKQTKLKQKNKREEKYLTDLDFDNI